MTHGVPCDVRSPTRNCGASPQKPGTPSNFRSLAGSFKPTKMSPAAARQRPHTRPTAPQPPNNNHRFTQSEVLKDEKPTSPPQYGSLNRSPNDIKWFTWGVCVTLNISILFSNKMSASPDSVFRCSILCFRFSWFPASGVYCNLLHLHLVDNTSAILQAKSVLIRQSGNSLVKEKSPQ